MKYAGWILFIFFAASCNLSQQGAASQEEIQAFQHMSDSFQHPPFSSRPGAYWCWLNGDVTKESITYDLEEMKAKGMGRAEIWDVAAIYNPNKAFGVGPAFLGDSSVALVQHALHEGKRLGMKIGIIGSSGWNAGGSWVQPEWAAKALYHAELKVKGPLRFSGPLPFPTVPEKCPRAANGLPVYYKDVAVIAIPSQAKDKQVAFDQIRVLSRQFDGQNLQWEVPAGEWTLIRFVCSNTGQHLIVPSPNSDGLLIDFLDPQATIKHLTFMLERLGIHPDSTGSAGLACVSFDSMELDEGISWTDSLESIFFNHHGYSIIPYLPSLAGWKVAGGKDDFIQQFHKTISDQLILSHYTTGKKFLSKYGIELVAEAGGPGPPIWNTCPVEALKALGQVDVPRGEFWIRNRYNIFLVKEIASASHIYGLPLTDAESFTTWRRWKDAPHDLKPYVDRAFCEGLNSITIHAFGNTRPEFGLPGRAYHAGSDINTTATWWPQAKGFMDYLSRCSYMLRQGKFVADVAYYYGDKAPHFFPELQESPDKPSLQGLSFGHDFDVINTDVLVNRMNYKDGKLQLPDGMNYQLLVIPDSIDLPAPAREKISLLIKSGAHVLVQNPAFLAADVAAKALHNSSIDEALQSLQIAKDFIADAEKLDFIHRKAAGADIYFVRNKTNEPVTENCQFRSAAGQVELWDPVTGLSYQLEPAEVENRTSRLQLHLPAGGSCFILFSPVKRKLPVMSKRPADGTAIIQGPWQLSFPENWGAPAAINMDTLASWTTNSNEGVRYFSGTATYKKAFTVTQESLASDSVIALNLHAVRDIAEVFVNGHEAGTVWTDPFKIDIKPWLKAGENTLEIKVTNMWINRLTGDLQQKGGRKYCNTNIPPIARYGSPVGDETYHLQDAGLLGPVSLDSYRYASAK